MTGTWDLWHGGHLVATIQDLQRWCRRQNMTLEDFFRLDGAQYMPNDLKAAARAVGYAGD